MTDGEFMVVLESRLAEWTAAHGRTATPPLQAVAGPPPRLSQ
ncbi:hypothetical protein ABIE52_006840 [Rhodococcus sp. OAS809]